jgi:hypothetical protein
MVDYYSNMGRLVKEIEVYKSAVLKRMAKAKPTDNLTEVIRLACGFSEEEAKDILLAEFARQNDGVQSDTFKIGCVWEDLKSKKFKVANVRSDRQLRLLMLPYFLPYMNKKWQQMGKQLGIKKWDQRWIDHINEIYPKTKGTQDYDALLKGLERIIATIKKNKAFRKYKNEVWDRWREKLDELPEFTNK